MAPDRHDTGPRSWPALLLVALLSGCGGGDDSSLQPEPPPPPAPAPTLAVTAVYPALSFSSPVGMLQAPADATRWFVVEQGGLVRVFANDATVTTTSTFIDISGRISGDGEAGLLGLAFHPSFPADPRAYLFYTAPGSPLIVRVSSFVTPDGGQTLDSASETILLSVPKLESNHNGGQLVFGPDGFLYIGIGDGGGSGDQHGSIGNGQSTQTLLGKVLRVDVDANTGGAPYGIPAGNPFAGNALCGIGGTGAPCAEIYAWGLRNPWRFSFDRTGGALWIADVGQGSWEEIDRITAPANLGWRCREGAHVFNSDCGPATDLVDPVAEYDHSLGISVTGGYVYRGNTYTNLRGRYVFGDFGSGRLWSIAADSSGSTISISGGDQSGLSIASFAEGNDGEIYVVDYGGLLYRLTAS